MALVLSTKAHARVKKVDTSKALAVPGVIDYIDHNDVPGQKTWGGIVPDQDLFCSEEVKYYFLKIFINILFRRKRTRKALLLRAITTNHKCENCSLGI